MLDIELNKDLLGLVKNKRVALIGPAPHLVGKNLGRYLDGYDVVCRVNEIIPSPNYRCDYGSRTDVMFHNCATSYLHTLENKIDESPKEFAQLKMACCLSTKASNSGDDSNYLSWPDDHVSDVVGNFSKVNVHNIPFYWIGVKDYRNLYNAIGHQPYSGTSTIAVLSRYPVKELLITGMTFHLNGDSHNELYIDGHWDKVQLAKTSPNGWHGGFHGPGNDRQVKFLKSIMMSTESIVVDSVLSDLLKFPQSNHPRVMKIHHGRGG